MQKLMTLNEAARSIPGVRRNPSTLWRWCRVGCLARNGTRVRLEHVRVGGQLLVPDGALKRFFDTLAAADVEHFAERAEEPSPPPSKPVKAAVQRVEQARAEARLRAAGLLS